MNEKAALPIRPSLPAEAFAGPLALVGSGAPLIMVLGGAGTGITRFLHELR